MSERLKHQLGSLDKQDYGAYQSLRGEHAFPEYALFMDQIQKDPYAPPSTGIFRVRVSRSIAGFPEDMARSKVREIALRDYLARQFYRNCVALSKGRRGTGNSGVITIAEPGQAILERSSIVINSEFVEARFFIGLPAENRSIHASLAEAMLFDELPAIVKTSLFLRSLQEDDVYEHIESAEDAEFLRRSLRENDLVAFIQDGAILPRASGIDERPKESGAVVPFAAPDSLRVEFTLPNRGKVTGMGIAKGVTLIVGGGYHGKSTLLQALEQGVYNHIPGDGRELCVALGDAVKIRASSGRYVIHDDISPFLTNIPRQKQTRDFSTLNASGSTSQAASIVEAIEAGAEVFFMDEDTCAANFMIRDKRMQELVRKEDEPITAFIDNIRMLYEEKGISTVLVMGGSGDYFELADKVIQMKEYLPEDVTARAHEIAKSNDTGRVKESGKGFGSEFVRVPLKDSIDPLNEYGRVRISAPEPDHLIFGQIDVDLEDAEQVKEKAQTKGIGMAILFAKKHMDEARTIDEVIRLVMDEVAAHGIDILDGKLTGDIAGFRGLDMAMALNRMRGFEVKQVAKAHGGKR
jgi:predicted ABC-class ATPase